MSKNVVYPAREDSNRYLLGLPGLLHEKERSRIDDLLEKLSQDSNITGIRVNSPGINIEGSSIVCRVVLEESIQALHQTISSLPNEAKIGFLGSSFSCGVFGHYIASLDLNPFSGSALISPSPGWNYFLTEEKRADILRAKKGLSMTTERDQLKGIIRFIPQDYLEGIIKLDAINALANKKLVDMNVLTLMGNLDNIVNPNAMEIYHYALGGRAEGILRYNSGHDIPYEETKKSLSDFCIKTLS